MEAGTGIEPVFTDLQSKEKLSLSRDLAQKKYHDRTRTSGERDTRSKRTNTLSQSIKPHHKAASRTLGYALTSACYESWKLAAGVFQLRLEDAERAALAWAVLKSLEPQQVDVVAKAVLVGAGYPLPSFMDADADAQFWADLASPAELRAFAFAAFRQMSRHDQVQFMQNAPWRAAA